jgi:hypothetical protein
MSENDVSLLDRLREFETTFEQKYRRKMTEEELKMLDAAKETIQQRLGADGSDKKRA